MQLRRISPSAARYSIDSGMYQMAKKPTVALLVICLIATASANAAKRSHLPMNATKLLRLLDTAVAAQDTPKVARIVRTLVVLGHHGKRAIRQRLKRDADASTPHILVALSRMSPEMRILAKPLLTLSLIHI